MSQTIAEKASAKFIDRLDNPFKDHPEGTAALDKVRIRQKKELAVVIQDALDEAKEGWIGVAKCRNCKREVRCYLDEVGSGGVVCETCIARQKALAVIRAERQPTDAHARCCLHTLTRVENAVENELRET